ncbi:MAG: hypothetical protein ACK2UW_00830 [Anaerolineales bacterium]|jgi:hypothetical protein
MLIEVGVSVGVTAVDEGCEVGVLISTGFVGELVAAGTFAVGLEEGVWVAPDGVHAIRKISRAAISHAFRYMFTPIVKKFSHF